MIESAKICAIAIICVVLCVLIKNARSEFVIPTKLASIIIIFIFILGLINPIIDHIKSIVGQTIPLEYMKILLKSLAIAYMTQISSELCRECGEGNIAFEIETVGKIEIIILSLPLINKVIEMSREMISW